MPSPFPGMDPYLEDPGLWPDVHHGLISVTQELLNQILRPKYYARVEERLYVSDDNDPGRAVIIPDVRIAHRLRPARSGSQAAQSVATIEPVIATTLIEEEVHEPRLEIIDRAARAVVTVIEILSPTNKVHNSRGRESYYQKRREVMTSPTHLVEIDLLRSGERIPVLGGAPPCDYLVHVSRVEKRPKGMWPIQLQQKLPVIPVPLRGEDPDAQLDMQSVLSTAYDRAAYDLEIDYAADPVPPLSPEAAAWARGILGSRHPA